MNSDRSFARILFVYLFIVSCFCGLCRSEELPAASAQEVRMSGEKLDLVKVAVQKLIDEEKIAGASVLVARRGKIVFNETFGMMDIAAEKAVKKDTIFRIYSMTKPVTSVAAMMLQTAILPVNSSIQGGDRTSMKGSASTPDQKDSAAPMLKVVPPRGQCRCANQL